MIMADVLKIFLLIVATMSVLVCYWLCAYALFRPLVERTREQYIHSPFRITATGAVVAVPLVLFGLVLFENLSGHPLAGLLAMASLLLPLLFGLIGSAGLCLQVGMGLPSSLDETQPWRQPLRGGVVLAFVFLLPFLGWFALLPWTLVSGLGASIRAIRAMRRESGIERLRREVEAGVQ
jgi:hypothetical protein